MKSITIVINVPDGVEVKVDQGAAKPFVARPAPGEPNEPCPVHGTPWRLVPAGTSKKTGKAYNAFWVCMTEGCDERPGRHDNLEELSFLDA